LGAALKRLHNCKLIYDTHELETQVSSSRGLRRFYSERSERTLIKYCDAVICVSDGIADWYATNYGIERPLVVRNVPDRRFQSITNAAENLRARCGIPPESLIFLYQGRLSPGRQVEQIIEAFLGLPKSYHLLFMGSGELEGDVRQAAANHPNIHLCPMVPPSQVLAYTTQADIGLIGMEDTCLNHRLSLPNKLFEYLVAGIPVIIPDFPEMRRLVDRYQCGWSWCGGTASFGKLILSLSKQEVCERKLCAASAGNGVSWENEEQNLLRLYQRLMG